MKTTARFKFDEISAVKTLAVALGTTATDYINALRGAAVGRKQPVSVHVFERWMRLRFGSDAQLAMDENLLARLRSELVSGKFRSEAGRLYRSLARQVPTDVFALHNRLVGHSPLVTRRLIDSHRFGRLAFIASLTPQTRAALQWFSGKGTRVLPNGHAQMLTQATRDGSLAAALWLLRATGVAGLELVTTEHVDELLPDPDPDDHEFRKISRWLHNCKPLFKACVRAGQLPSNPLEDCGSSMFAAYAQRDFLPPAEVERVRDLSTVNMGDWQQVRDRLTVLLLIDSAMRKGEVSGIELKDVNETHDGGFQLRLGSSAQKMVGKPAALIGTLYPETATLMKLYLDEIRPRCDGTMLLVDCNGQDAQPEAVYEAVVREGTRLGLQCYYTKQRPGCHALRRTFATINSSPLGLSLSTAELAERMRTSYDVVYEHYVVRNPLRSTLTEEAYRRRIIADPIRQGMNYLDGLAGVGIDDTMLAPIRRSLEAMRKPVPETTVSQATIEWISEADAFGLLRDSWSMLPPPRTFRAYMKGAGHTCRRGHRGGVHMNAEKVRLLVSGYVPVHDVVATAEHILEVPAELVGERIGRLVLVRRVDVADVIRVIQKDRGGNPDGSPRCQTGRQGCVKQAAGQGIVGDRKIA